MPGQSQEFKTPQFERISFESDYETLKFIEEERKKQAVLLYCGTEFKEILLLQQKDAIYIDSAIQTDALRNLDARVEDKY